MKEYTTEYRTAIEEINNKLISQGYEKTVLRAKKSTFKHFGKDIEMYDIIAAYEGKDVIILDCKDKGGAEGYYRTDIKVHFFNPVKGTKRSIDSLIRKELRKKPEIECKSNERIKIKNYFFRMTN